MKEKHVERLTKGKKSGINIGSRGVPHRLNNHEQKKLEIAIKRRFLTISFDSRINLTNIWKKYAEVKQWPLLIVKRLQDGHAEVFHGNNTLKFTSYKKAAEYAKISAKG